MTKEATARIKINKLLEAAGWRFFADGNDAANIRLEPSVTIKSTDLDALGDNFEKIERGFIDFLLLDAKGFSLLVLEAKAEAKNPLDGKEQARKYARSQNCRDVLPEYLYFALLALHARHGSKSVGAVFKNLTTDQIREFKIALPLLATQQTLVAGIEAEQALVAGNRELIARFEKNIQATLARVWGEDEPPLAIDSASIRSEPSTADRSTPAVAELLPH